MDSLYNGMDCFLSLVFADLHTLTTMPQAEQLRENSRRTAVTLLAVGLDPKRSCIFRQSDVSRRSLVAKKMVLYKRVLPIALYRSHSTRSWPGY